MAALGAALHALLAAWERQHPDAGIAFHADGTLSLPVPLGGPGEAPIPAAPAPIAWPEPSAAPEMARGQFNQAVGVYNAATSQFPAMLWRGPSWHAPRNAPLI